jgi:type IV conjugative transfer system lipoprotein TraV
MLISSKKSSVMAFIRRLLAACIALVVASCAGGLSGVGGSSTPTCPPMSEGAACQPISKTYRDVTTGSFKSSGVSSNPSKNDAQGIPRPSSSSMVWQAGDGQNVGNGTPLPPQPRYMAGSPSTVGASPIERLTPNTGKPLRSAAEVLRIWVAPYEDDDGVLHDQSFAYVVVDPGRWLIEHNQRRIQNEFRAVAGPANAPSTTGQIPAPTEREEAASVAMKAVASGTSGEEKEQK